MGLLPHPRAPSTWFSLSFERLRVVGRQIGGDQPELLQRRIEVVNDLLRGDLGRGQVVAVLQAFVLEPNMSRIALSRASGPPASPPARAPTRHDCSANNPELSITEYPNWCGLAANWVVRIDKSFWVQPALSCTACPATSV